MRDSVAFVRFVLMFSMTLSIIDAVQVTSRFAPPINYQPLTNIAIDTSSGTVFIGAKNRIYQLDQNLTQVAEAVTGPVLDNPYCYDTTTFGNSYCSYLYKPGTTQAQLTDNYNQVISHLIGAQFSILKVFRDVI